MICNCRFNDDMIRKQREELVLLTRDLKSQEEQISKLFGENNSLIASLKAHETKQLEAGKTILGLNKEISHLKGKPTRVT